MCVCNDDTVIHNVAITMCYIDTVIYDVKSNTITELNNKFSEDLSIT